MTSDTKNSNFTTAQADAETRNKTDYCAFISYRHLDNEQPGREWATWLHNRLETYDVPKKFRGQTNERGDVIPERIYPVFRDEKDLPADAELAAGIRHALDRSKCLIVLCSPRSAQSRYVSDEVAYFKRIGRGDRIISVLLDGEPNVSWDAKKRESGFTSDQECFPFTLMHPVDETGRMEGNVWVEPIAADFRLPNNGGQGWCSATDYRRALNRDTAHTPDAVARLAATQEQILAAGLRKIVAGVLGIPARDYEMEEEAFRAEQSRRRIRVLMAWLATVLVLAVCAVGAAVYGWVKEREAVRQKNEATLQTEIATKSLLFVGDIFSQTDPREGGNKQITVLEVLTNAIPAIQKLEPWQLKASVLDIVGNLLVSLCEYSHALPLLEEARALSSDSEHNGEIHLETAFRWHDVGMVYQKQGDYEKAKEAYKQMSNICLKLHQIDANNSDTYRTLSVGYERLGVLHLELGNGKEAQSYCEKALVIVEELHERSLSNTGRMRNLLGANYESDIAVNYERLGNMHFGFGNGQIAQSYYEKSLAIQEILCRRNPQNVAYARELAVGYSKLGDIYLELGNERKARENYEKRLVITERLCDHNPQDADYMVDLAVSYERLGDMQNDFGNWKEAQSYHEKALAISEELHVRNPQNTDYVLSLCVNYNKLGDIFFGNRNMEDARKHYEKAVTIANELHVSNPQNVDYAQNLSISYSILGRMYLGLENEIEAKNYCEKALVIQEAHCIRDPQNVNYARSLSVSYNRLGEIYLRQRDWKEAQSCREKALVISEELRARNPQSVDYMRKLSADYSNLGDLHLELKNEKEAREYYEKAVASAEELHTHSPQNNAYKQGLSVLYNNLAQLHLKLENWQEAQAYYEKALVVAQKLRTHDPQNMDYAQNLLLGYNNLGDAHLGPENWKGVQSYYEKALVVAQELRTHDPQNMGYAQNMLLCYNNLGDAYLGAENWMGAQSYYEKALVVAQELRTHDPQDMDYAQDMLLCYNNLGDAYLDAENWKGAQAYYEKALVVAQELRTNDSQNMDYAQNLSISYSNLGDVHLGLESLKEARSYYEKALTIAKELQIRNPQNTIYARDMWVFYSKMAEVTEKYQSDEAPLWWEKAYTQISDMKRQGILFPADEKRVDVFRENWERTKASQSGKKKP